MNDVQQSLIESIQILAGERLKNINFTKSFTGIVIEVNGLQAIVEINGSNSDCIIPQNLSSYIGKNDIVIVQDISNTKSQKIVQGVISSTNRDMFHIYDTVEDRIVSSIEQLWDEELQQEIHVVFEIE
ncbi:hypothetical protein [Bacillus gaemokensis]|uniref:Uncharacterized protein n=1 Tax=Bacillus gaemokensis TaxID=574375 RepID=A0A073KNL5_9BACI|nr:hypothetical protein [Bacillus gaemokensis]KEK23933.1 hypothetical protein BAGA_05810 [Bacillus gaemokensis]KYG38056.1 hypothetical protein AZF08_20055 [Bacillus gaemokensis]